MNVTLLRFFVSIQLLTCLLSIASIQRAAAQVQAQTGNAIPDPFAPYVTGPYVDKYGQKISADWPDKVKSDADLKKDIDQESVRLKAWKPVIGEYDKYGGNRRLGWQSKATGYFRTLKHNGVWWLISPDGNPCFYKGLDNAPALKWETTPITGREGLFEDLPSKDGPLGYAWGGDAWGSDPGIETFAFCTSNLIRKYGASWQDSFRKLTVQRTAAWGFSGTGKWGDAILGIPSVSVLDHTGVPVPFTGAHPDPFDPNTQSTLKKVLAAQITPQLTNPTIVAWSVGNEGAELIEPDEVLSVLQLGAEVPGKKALIDYAIDTLYQGSTTKLQAAWTFTEATASDRNSLYAAQTISVPDTDLEALREFYANRYYSLIYQTVKSIDKNHLYAGFWIVQGFYQDEPDWLLIAGNCDMVGFDTYDFDFEKHGVSRLFKLTNKPVFCGEFSFPQSEIERGYSDFGSLSLKDQAASGAAYKQFVTDAATNPYCVGICWFQYRDEPVTGRGPGYGPDIIYGENYPLGLIDIADQPKWTLIDAVRKSNLAADSLHVHAQK